MLGDSSGNTFVSININELPIVTPFDVVGVIINLCSVAGKLIVVVGRNTGVTNCPALSLFSFRAARRMG